MSRRLIDVIESHTGAVLVSGAICLKVAVITGGWILLISGFGALTLVAVIKIKKWRDDK